MLRFADNVAAQLDTTTAPRVTGVVRSRHMHARSVSPAVVARRRAANKVARVSRRANRRR